MRRRRSGMIYGLMEFTAALLFFALCATVCVSLYASARTISSDTMQLRSALREAANIAEAVKAGELHQLAYDWDLSETQWMASSIEHKNVHVIITFTGKHTDLYTGSVAIEQDGIKLVELPYTSHQEVTP